MRHVIVLTLATLILSGCPSAAPKVLDSVTIGQTSTDDEIRLVLPLTIICPPARAGAFLFSDKPIKEIDGSDTLTLMIGSGAAWGPDEWVVRCHTYEGLKKEDHYVRVDWDMLGFDEARQRRIVALAKRHGVKAPETIYTFANYWLHSEDGCGEQVRRIVGGEARWLYTFEKIESTEFVTVVRKRRQRVRIVSPAPPAAGTNRPAEPSPKSTARQR